MERNRFENSTFENPNPAQEHPSRIGYHRGILNAVLIITCVI